MRLTFTDSALGDLKRLRTFIAEKTPQAAQRISQRLVSSIKRLTDQPQMGVNVEELDGVKDFIAGDYVVRYTGLDNELFILRIWHAKEDR